jgi:ABC-type branched-subunit amino acid transport system ATPase component
MTTPMLEAVNLSVQFGGLMAVNNVSFEVWPNEVFSLIGPNGAGKTTIFNLISGPLPADLGRGHASRAR